MNKTGAELVVDCLEELGVEYVFCLPGASIDPILNVLKDRGPKVILCRHEQNAVFAALGYAKLTQKPGIVLVTAGPGATNIVTGMATAFSERNPVIAITGQVVQRIKFKHSHQNIDAKALFKPITKWSEELDSVEIIPQVLANAFQIAMTPKAGPVHIAIPYNLLNEKTLEKPIPYKEFSYFRSLSEEIDAVAKEIESSEKPLVLLGNGANSSRYSLAICDFLKKCQMPVAGTFEAAGAIAKELVYLFMGRLGVFKNQPGDRVLDLADLIITIGFDPVEYDPVIWNKRNTKIIHIDLTPPILDSAYQPIFQLVGDIEANLFELAKRLKKKDYYSYRKEVVLAHEILEERMQSGKMIESFPLHPLKVIYETKKYLSEKTTVISDVGSHQYFWARYFFCFKPKYFITSMGFQTMGVSLPFAIAAALVRPDEKVFSISGDGSFLMCSMALETIKRYNLPIIHMVWEDNSYNLVKIQQEKKYLRSFAVDFGPIDTVSYAKSIGIAAYKVHSFEAFEDVLRKAFDQEGPCVISIPIDYHENFNIIETLSE
ncbi:MAG TPA: acetolactate synthase AlsS [Chlamydiales bacterium]|nr:acetolactate synthase AlsS [Chlamydiales bacterium]